MATEHRIHLHVVFMRESDGWVAQALQHDFAGQGATRPEALRALAHTIASHIFVASRHGLSDALASVPAAPTQFWEMFEVAARHRTEAADLHAPGLPPAFVIQAVADSENGLTQ